MSRSWTWRRGPSYLLVPTRLRSPEGRDRSPEVGDLQPALQSLTRRSGRAGSSIVTRPAAPTSTARSTPLAPTNESSASIHGTACLASGTARTESSTYPMPTSYSRSHRTDVTAGPKLPATSRIRTERGPRLLTGRGASCPSGRIQEPLGDRSLDYELAGLTDRTLALVRR